MNITEIKPGVHYVGVNDRTTTRFEGLWSLPYGVSLNAYVVEDEKIAIIDTVEEARGSVYFANLRRVLGDRRPDYIIVNHMEPDHSASILGLRALYPDVQVVGNKKTLDMLDGYYGINTNTLCVADGDTLSLGRKTLQFFFAPMVHWPEVMVTYLPELELLFSADAFGTFGALNGGILDTQLTLDHYWDEMRRYYACIVGKYGRPVQAALKKLSGLKLKTICSTHGPVWTEHIPEVVAIYDRLSRYEAEEGVVIAYGSMYGNTEQMAEQLARQLAARGEKNIRIYNLSYADISCVIRDIFKYDTLVIGSPTYNGELYPEVRSLLTKIEERAVPSRRLALFGSFTWAGAAVKRLGEFAAQMKWEVIGTPVEMKQGYSAKIEPQLEALAEAMKR